MGQIDESIAISVGQERRPPMQIGKDIEYTEVTRGVRMLLLGIIGLVALFVILSLVVKVEEVARARGEFVPISRVQVIQTPEGGALEAILVRNDDRVTTGQLIAKFRAVDLVRDLEQTRVRIAYLQIEMERLDAFSAGRAPVFDTFKVQHSNMVAEAVSLNAEQVRHLARNLDQVDRQIDEEKAGLAAARREIPAATSSLNATRELLQRTRDGVRSGVIAQNRLAQVEEQAAQSERVHTQIVASVDQRTARIRSLEAQREVVLAKAAGDARDERAKLLVQLNELQAAQAAYQSRSTDIEVRAPIGGIVHKISETPVGTVIPAGGTVCEIVPTEGGVLIQVQVSPRDIGFVRTGQKAVVKSDAFDYGRFGSIPGRITRIAPSNTPGTSGQSPYFLAEVELDQPHVGANREYIVTPGMTGEVSILTGEKTIFQYLLKPIYLTLDTALHER